MPDTLEVVVIGAGFSGLAAAATLAQLGHSVTVLERHPTSGGRARTWCKDGFVCDLGPSWYWMPDVFDAFFARFGKKTADRYELKRLDPAYRTFIEKSEAVAGASGVGQPYLDVPDSPEELEALFESREVGAGAKLRLFLDEAQYKYKVAMRDYVYRPSVTLWEFVDLRILYESVFQLDMLSSQATHVRKFFTDSALIKLMEWPVLFLGGAPKDVPAMYSLMDHVAVKLGTHYPMGGFSKVSDSLEALCREQGVKFEFGAEVESIGVDDATSAVRGVSVAGGQTFAADAVVASADYHWAEQKLLAPQWRTMNEQQWEDITMSPSSLLCFLGVKGSISNLLHHNLFFDEPLEPHAKEIYDDPAWPKRPLFYVCAPSKTDKSVAPPGHENLMILIPLAAGLEDSQEKREQYYSLVMQRLEERTGEKLADRVVLKRLYAMSDFENDYHSYRGNAYGLANTLMQTGPFKPCMKSKVNGLYFAGHLTVPGPGVPPALISGEIVADLLHLEMTVASAGRNWLWFLGLLLASLLCVWKSSLVPVLPALAASATYGTAGLATICMLWSTMSAFVSIALALVRIIYSYFRSKSPIETTCFNGSASFYFSSFFFDSTMRERLYYLYAYCRKCDDTIDDQQGTIADLNTELDKAFAPGASETDSPLARLAHHKHAERNHAALLVQGQAFDDANSGKLRIDDEAELLDYCIRVAGSVGLMCTTCFGVHAPRALAAACDLGVGFQLTNIARDIRTDATTLGRIYVPATWMADGAAERLLAGEATDDELLGWAARLVALGEGYYASAQTGVELLPAPLHTPVRITMHIYREIGLQLGGVTAYPTRMRVSTARKFALACGIGKTALAADSRSSRGPLLRLLAEFDK